MLSARYEDFIGWLTADALPLWFDRGLDRERGGFVEKLSPTGCVIEESRRARVCGRQIFVFATAEQWAWHKEADFAVRHGLDWLQFAHVDHQGVIVPLADDTGTPLRKDFDLYDHAFVLFGLAAADEVAIDSPQESVALAILRAMARWKHPVAGFEEARPRALPLKANPHMHMLEACLAWERRSKNGVWAELADEIVKLCVGRFLCRITGALREYFDGDWRQIDTLPNDVIEPGHQAEWAWLLIRWAKARRDETVIIYAQRLLQIAEDAGRSVSENLLVNELNADLSLRDARMRLWPQTERIKALLARASLCEESNERALIEDRVAAAIVGLMRFFDHPVRGSWWEHIGPDGRPIEEPARASSLYHIVCAASELMNYMRRYDAVAA